MNDSNLEGRTVDFGEYRSAVGNPWRVLPECQVSKRSVNIFEQIKQFGFLSFDDRAEPESANANSVLLSLMEFCSSIFCLGPRSLIRRCL